MPLLWRAAATKPTATAAECVSFELFVCDLQWRLYAFFFIVIHNFIGFFFLTVFVFFISVILVFYTSTYFYFISYTFAMRRGEPHIR